MTASFVRLRRYLLWQVEDAASVGSLALGQLWARSLVLMGALARALSLAFVGTVWLTFEVYGRTWGGLNGFVEQVSPISSLSPYRIFFCLVFSEISGHLLLYAFTPWGLSIRTFVLALLHGILVHAGWVVGPRWCRQQLGMRPVRYDPDHPFDNIDPAR